MTTIKIKVSELLRLSKKSKGYQVETKSGNILSNFAKYKRGYVECDINGQPKAGLFDGSTIIEILD